MPSHQFLNIVHCFVLVLHVTLKSLPLMYRAKKNAATAEAEIFYTEPHIVR